MPAIIAQKWRCPACGTTSDSPFASCPDCGGKKAGVPVHHCELHGDLDEATCPSCQRLEQETSRIAKERQAKKDIEKRRVEARPLDKEASERLSHKEPERKGPSEEKTKKPEKETGCLQCLGTLLLIGMAINFAGMACKWLISLFK